MRIAVEQCTRVQLLEIIASLQERIFVLVSDNEHLRDTIHELGCALDNVGDILSAYELSRLGGRDDE